MNRAAVLSNVIAGLQSINVTISELIQFVLVHRQYNDPTQPIYCDLLQNVKPILASLYYHPATQDATRQWAHDAMCVHYSKLVHKLTRVEHGWHFSASRADPSQVRDFDIEEMARGMAELAPELWSLVQTLLRGVVAAQHDAPGIPADRMNVDGGGSDSDSEEDYWAAFEGEQGDPGEAGKLGSRFSRTMLACFRTVVILSIIMQTRDQRCNALQSNTGIFCHAANAPEKLVKVLSRMGVAVSLTTIHRAVKSLARESKEELRDMGQTLLNTHVYDNLEFLLNVSISTLDKPADGLLHFTSGALLRLEHDVTLEDLRCSDLLWNRSPLNLRASDPRPFDPYKMLNKLYTLHTERAPGPGQLTRRGRYRSWFLMQLLISHGPPEFKHLKRALPNPEAVEAIPVTKLRHRPLQTMELNQSKVSGNIAAILDMFSQTGLGDPHQKNLDDVVDISEFVTILHGDLGTYECVQGARRRRSVEKTPYDRLQSVVCVPGLFHFKMAAADALWRILMEPSKTQSDTRSFRSIVGKLRPGESSKLVHNAKFRQQHQLIRHVLAVLALDAWRVEVTRRTRYSSLEEWAQSKPKLEDVQSIADAVVRDYVEGEGLDLYEFERQPKGQRDEVRANTMRTLNYLLLYEELAYAMNAGDIGRVETLLVPWIRIFRATGKHKYCTYTLQFMYDLYFVYPERLRRAIRYNMLVNPTGRELEFRAVDWVMELQNLFTKVIYGGESSNHTKARIILESVLIDIFRNSHASLERNFALHGLSHKHATKDMKATFAMILNYLQAQKPNEYEAGRPSPHVVPDILLEGAELIAQELRRKGFAMGQDADDAAPAPDGEASVDELDMEIDIEDLAVEGLMF